MTFIHINHNVKGRDIPGGTYETSNNIVWAEKTEIPEIESIGLFPDKGLIWKGPQH